MSTAVLRVNLVIVWLAERGRCDIIDNRSKHYYHVYQARSYLYAKYAAAENGLVKVLSGSCSSEMYVGYKIAEYRRNYLEYHVLPLNVQ